VIDEAQLDSSAIAFTARVLRLPPGTPAEATQLEDFAVEVASFPRFSSRSRSSR
jgi:hypothetical protein